MEEESKMQVLEKILLFIDDDVIGFQLPEQEQPMLHTDIWVFIVIW